jgi:hypothetical protein
MEEHSMAREDRDGSAIDVDFMRMSPVFVSEVS